MINKLVVASAISAVFALVNSDVTALPMASNASIPGQSAPWAYNTGAYGVTGVPAATPTVYFSQVNATTINVITAFNQVKGSIQKKKTLNATVTPETFGCLAALTGAFTLTNKSLIQKGTQCQYIAVGTLLSKKYYKINLSEADLAQLGAKVGISFSAVTKANAYRTAKIATLWQ